MNNIRNILFNGHDFRFINPVIRYLQNHPDYQVLIDEHPGHVIVDTQKSAHLSEKANIIFCEWCLGNAEWYSWHKKANQSLIIHLHHQELELDYLDKINWENVDRIVFICQNNMRRFLKRFPTLADRALLIYNPIDCQAFGVPKLYGAEFNLGFVGLSPKRKAPHLAIELFKRLKKADNRFTLFFKGKLPWEYDWLWRRADEQQYYREFFEDIERYEYKNSIVFESYSNDMPGWYSKIGFLLSTSDHEGSHQAVAEGMASGAIPVIRNWTGADLLYPEKYVFITVDEAEECIHRWKTPEQYINEVVLSKEYACQYFDQSKILQTYLTLFEELVQSKINITREFSNDLPRSLTEDRRKGSKYPVVMHVCYINPKSLDGYVTRVIEETRVLHKIGVRVVLVCLFNQDFLSPPDLILDHLNFLREYTGALVHLIPVYDFFNLAAMKEGRDEVTNQILEIAAYYHIKLLHSQSIYSTLYTLQANKQLKAKLVFDVHGSAPEEAEMNGEHPVRINALSEGEKDILAEADLVVFVSNSMKNYYSEKYSLPFDNSVIIPTCVQSNRFDMAYELRNKKRQELSLDDKFVILYLGTLSLWQWPEAMVSLCEQIYRLRPDAFFYFLLPQSDHEKAIHLFKNCNLPTQSYRIDEVPHSEIGSIIGIADAGLLLRKSHPVNFVSSPTKFGEYIAAGVPVITTENVGDISKIVEQENLGLVLSFEEDNLFPGELDKLNNFMENVRNKRKLWMDRCANYARTKLDWSIYGAFLSETYTKLLWNEQGDR